jgi:mRNA interferase MazF
MDADLSSGSLQVTSYARPGKLFTASEGLITSVLGTLTAEAFERTIDAIVALLKP